MVVIFLQMVRISPVISDGNVLSRFPIKDFPCMLFHIGGKVQFEELVYKKIRDFNANLIN